MADFNLGRAIEQTAVKISAELVAELISKTLSTLNPIQSQWAFSEFNTGGVSLDIAGLSAGLTGGVLKLKQAGKSNPYSYNCLSIDGGIGTPYPIPFNISFPLPNTPGTGIVLRMPRAFGELTPNAFRGGFCGCSFSAQCGVGVGINFIFMGAMIIPDAQSLMLSTIQQLLTSCKAIIVCAGFGGSFFPGSAGTAYSIGGSI